MNVNKKLCIAKNLIIDDDTSKYDIVSKNYKYIFEYYLSRKINLNEYDLEISNSNLYFGLIKEKLNINVYLKTNYLFLLNHFYVEKLDIGDIEKIYNFSGINNEVLNIVERTYKDVIKDNYLNGEYTNLKYKVSYGLAVPINMADNVDLVFKIYYGKNPSIVPDDEFMINLNKKNEFLDKLSNKLMNEVKEKLDLNCTVLREKMM